LRRHRRRRLCPLRTRHAFAAGSNAIGTGSPNCSWQRRSPMPKKKNFGCVIVSLAVDGFLWVIALLATCGRTCLEEYYLWRTWRCTAAMVHRQPVTNYSSRLVTFSPKISSPSFTFYNW
jgi:hypothetical protein